jgi:hypothetical protein
MEMHGCVGELGIVHPHAALLTLARAWPKNREVSLGDVGRLVERIGMSY